MRIIYGKDFYDSALSYGADTSITLVRQKEQFIEAVGFYHPMITFSIYEKMKDGSTRFVDMYRRSLSDGFKTYTVAAIVADMMYFGVELQFSMFDFDNPDPVFCWSEDKFEAALNKQNHTLYPANEEVGKWSLLARMRRKYGNEDRSAADFFKPIKLPNSVRNKMIEMGASVATFRRSAWDGNNPRWRINGDDLKEIEFYRCRSAHEVFQEISMWVGGVLPKPGAPMVEISDKDRIHKHGFDQWSFRKPPEKKR
jgi:hypothetical protein